MRYLYLLMLVFLITSCESNRVFEKNVTLEERYWLANEPLSFEFTIDDTNRPYNLYFNIRNSLKFPYARLFVQYTLSDSTGQELDKKLISQFLFDQKTGKPEGNSSIGDVFDHRISILQNHHFVNPGKYQLQLEQFNRQDTLQGVLAVGARVEFTESH